MKHAPSPDTAWMTNRVCLSSDRDLFFPDGSTGTWIPIINQAKAICFTCPALWDCQDWAFDTREPYGIWGGLTEQERRRIHRRMAANPDLTREQATSAVLNPPLKDRPAAEVFAERTETDANGHTHWRPQSTSFFFGDRNRTPGQIAFILTHNREPDGHVTSSCGVGRCITGTHITDGQMRRAQRVEQAAA